jgi:hypothetical protein
VNFFGHAAVASWQATTTAGLALGAMLPDFAGMCGARIAAVTAVDVAGGVVLHHATDAVFHGAPPVRGLFAEAERRLAARGCRRGPMRAAAHVGVELLLDGVLVGEARHRDAYAAAIAIAPVPVTWRDDGDDVRFELLHARLRGHGVPHDLRRPAAVGERVVRALAGRRLLAPSPDERGAIAAVLAELAAVVEAATDAVLAAVRDGLAARAGAATSDQTSASAR